MENIGHQIGKDVVVVYPIFYRECSVKQIGNVIKKKQKKATQTFKAK